MATTRLPGVPLITAAQAAEILDVDIQQVYNLASRGTLARHKPPHVRLAYDLDEIEQRSLARIKLHATGHPYWVNANEAAAFLGVHRSRARQLLVEDRLPSVTAANGRRYVRRHQLEVIANAREAHLRLT